MICRFHSENGIAHLQRGPRDPSPANLSEDRITMIVGKDSGKRTEGGALPPLPALAG
jgi:hypothetical protein